MAGPLVTVLIDTYNHERFVEQAITSVLEQDMSMADVEIVVVDDGSTIVRRNRPQFEPRVRLIRKPNGGQASAFNIALPQTRGEMVAMLDGDDWWAKQKLRRALETLEANPDVGIVGHGQFESYCDGRPNVWFFPGASIEWTSLRSSGRNCSGTCWVSRHQQDDDSPVGARQDLPVPEELVIEADEYIFTLAPALAPAIILNEPLFYYGFTPATCSSFTAMSR